MKRNLYAILIIAVVAVVAAVGTRSCKQPSKDSISVVDSVHTDSVQVDSVDSTVCPD